jgi:large subunit ribosomal protein L30
MVRISLKRSYIGIPEKQKKVLKALGLRKIGSVVTRTDDKATQGMIQKVSHLISVERAEDAAGG